MSIILSHLLPWSDLKLTRIENPTLVEPEASSPLVSMSSARSGGSGQVTIPRPYVSKVGILPSSIPTYHKEYILRAQSGSDEEAGGAAAITEEPQPSRTDAEKEEAARRLKPHSRSQRSLEEGSKRPQGMTPVKETKRSKPVRWQFGIRSRNAPWEALLCIHKALHKLGAGYVPDEDYQRSHKRGDSETTGSHSGLHRSSSQRSQDPTKRYKLPADPWHIRVRWESQGTFWRHISTLLHITN